MLGVLIGGWLAVDALASLLVFRRQRLFPEQSIRVGRLLIGVVLIWNLV